MTRGTGSGEPAPDEPHSDETHPDETHPDEPTPDEPGTSAGDPGPDGSSVRPDGTGDGGDDASADTGAATAHAVEPGERLYYEPGGSWWVVAIGPVLVGTVLILEIVGPGQVHWPLMLIFAFIITGFSLVQVFAARKHVSVELTDTTLRQGTRVLPLHDIDTIYPANNSAEPKKWQSAKALGELHGVPRRRKGIGLKLTDGTLAQAWARDVERLRRELTDAHLAMRLGLPKPPKPSDP